MLVAVMVVVVASVVVVVVVVFVVVVVVNVWLLTVRTILALWGENGEKCQNSLRTQRRDCRRGGCR